jgi:hypothetical protein
MNLNLADSRVDLSVFGCGGERAEDAPRTLRLCSGIL